MAQKHTEIIDIQVSTVNIGIIEYINPKGIA